MDASTCMSNNCSTPSCGQEHKTDDHIRQCHGKEMLFPIRGKSRQRYFVDGTRGSNFHFRALLLNTACSLSISARPLWSPFSGYLCVFRVGAGAGRSAEAAGPGGAGTAGGQGPGAPRAAPRRNWWRALRTGAGASGAAAAANPARAGRPPFHILLGLFSLLACFCLTG